jgi:hypothetical protein
MKKPKGAVTPEGYRLQPFRFANRVFPFTTLPDLPGVHACWYYCRCAIGMMQKVDEGAQYEGENDHSVMLNNLARSVSMLYGLESPSDFLKFMPQVKHLAVSNQMPWDLRIENPGSHSFIRYLN